MAKIQAGQCITDGKLLNAIITVCSVGGGVTASALCCADICIFILPVLVE